MSRTDTAGEKKILEATELLKSMNPEAGLITTPWAELDGAQILSAMQENGLRADMEALKHEHEHHHHHDDDEDEHEHHHHHHDEDEDEHEHHHHHHDDDEDEHEHHHHHHDDDEDEHEHHHHHHHHDGEECDDPECECHHHHHHADEVFGSWGMETPRKFSEQELREKLSALSDEEKYGTVLRAKGIVNASDGDWIYFDYVPGETDIRRGAPAVTGRFCVIGSKIKEDALKELFSLA
jgi:hypothetical protein